MSAPSTPIGAAPPRPAPPARPGYRSVYLWHWPLRAMHWFSAGCILVLAVTGLFIGRPYFETAGEASDHFLMGKVRFVHFTAAAILVATAIVRAYWLFRGNKYERWQALFPFKASDWKNMAAVVRRYLNLNREAPHWLGHNPLQQLLFTVLYLVALTQVVTGFAMYGMSAPGGFFARAFAWVGPLFGGMQAARLVHHALTWFYGVFLPVHVYLSLRADLVHREARVSSIVGGFRFVRDDVKFIDA
jgi:Ni/Fe-hydrogenase 1 B-type cytochrome subunit